MRLLRFCVILILFSYLSGSNVEAQFSPDAFRQFINSPITPSQQFSSISQVRSFYDHRQFRPAWIFNSNARSQLFQLLSQSSGLGLDAADYKWSFITSLQEQSWKPFTQQDSFLLEANLTDAALHFFSDLAYGSQPPQLSYNGLDYRPSCHNIIAVVSSAVDNGTLVSVKKLIEPASAEYLSVKTKLEEYLSIIETPDFKDVVVKATTVNAGNTGLVKRLIQLRLLDSLPASLTTTALKSRVKEVQQIYNLTQDGILRATVLNELNVPLFTRVGELKITLNTLRWLNCVKTSGAIIVVNIPSATLIVYENGGVVLESGIIVGKKTTRTPTLSSRATEVVLYPYWMVPKSIATKELLPLIKKNYRYLDMNGMQVLDLNGRVVNPSLINWSELSSANFPYVLRQSTGCDNSLGLIKLNFYNPFNVYLHDTPAKNLFNFNKRYFSHGCMRVQKAMELGHLLLKGNTIAIDTLEDKGCLRNKSPIVVPATSPMPVFVLYNTAWVDSSARVNFSDDIYGRFLHLRKKPSTLSNTVGMNDRDQYHF
ncbi:MAG TPA: L,D-transpeptidase family protein [Chitinophagaceae bacterium]